MVTYFLFVPIATDSGFGGSVFVGSFCVDSVDDDEVGFKKSAQRSSTPLQKNKMV